MVRVWSSGPLVPGICTSRIRHAVSWIHGELKKSSAEEKDWTINPITLRSLLVEVRKDSSSSTSEIKAPARVRKAVDWAS
jgi:hypothetical protein